AKAIPSPTVWKKVLSTGNRKPSPSMVFAAGPYWTAAIKLVLAALRFHEEKSRGTAPEPGGRKESPGIPKTSLISWLHVKSVSTFSFQTLKSFSVALSEPACSE